MILPETPETPENLPRTTAWRRTLTRDHLERTREDSRRRGHEIRSSVTTPTRYNLEWTSEELAFLEEFRDELIAAQAEALGRSYGAVVEMRRKMGLAKRRVRYESLKGIDE